MWRVGGSSSTLGSSSSQGGVGGQSSHEAGTTPLRGYWKEMPGAGRTFEGRVSDMSVASSAHTLLPSAPRRRERGGGRKPTVGGSNIGGRGSGGGHGGSGGGGDSDDSSDDDDGGESSSSDDEDGEEEEDDDEDFLVGGVLLASGSAGWITALDVSTAAPLYTLEGEHPRYFTPGGGVAPGGR